MGILEFKDRGEFVQYLGDKDVAGLCFAEL